MLVKKKSRVEKLNDSKNLPRVENFTGRMSERWGLGKVVIPAPQDLDALMRKVPEARALQDGN